jgi:hypothetical protein
LLGALDRRRHALVGGGVCEVTLHIREPVRETVEDLRVQVLASPGDRLPGVLAQVILGPVVDGHADHRARQQPTSLEPVQRPERHDLGQVARDPEDHEDVR